MSALSLNQRSRAFYEQYFGGQDIGVVWDLGSRQARRVIRSLMSPGYQSVLELGSGIGILLSELDIPRRIGVDISVSSSVFAKGAAPDAAFVVADLNDPLPFHDGIFDVVVSGDVLEHIGRDDVAIAEAHRVLKPGGELVFHLPARKDSVVDHQRYEAFGHLRYYNQQLVKLLLAGRFEIEELRFGARIYNTFWLPLKPVLDLVSRAQNRLGILIAAVVNRVARREILRIERRTWLERWWYRHLLLPALEGVFFKVDMWVSSHISESGWPLDPRYYIDLRARKI